jgi:hypothetical protein
MKRAAELVLGLGLATSATACRTHEVLRKPDFSWNRMQSQPRYDDYAPSRFFADGMAMRAPPEGTVPYSASPVNPREREGTEKGGAYVKSFPLPITRPLLHLGRARFQIVCAACHGVRGDGDSVVAKYMPRRPPSLHEERIRVLPDGRIYSVIRDGYGLMPAYGTHFSVEERWAVVAYVRALERSQNAVVARLPASIARELERASR